MAATGNQRNRTIGVRRKAWTEDQVRALGVRIDGVVACEIVLGVGRSLAYELLRTEAVPFRVLRAGRRYVTSGADVLRALGLDPSPTAAGMTTQNGMRPNGADIGPPTSRAP